MEAIRKRIVIDEHQNPVAVLIDYEDWLSIAQRLEAQWQNQRSDQRKAFRALLEKTSGIWTGGDGLEYQQQIREEWTRPWDEEWLGPEPTADEDEK